MRKLGRPKKERHISKKPKTLTFSPRGRPGRPEEVEITIDEFEAIRLADFNEFEQVQGANEMSISRATFGRILRHARKKLADALVNGKIIRIAGGQINFPPKSR